MWQAVAPLPIGYPGEFATPPFDGAGMSERAPGWHRRRHERGRALLLLAGVRAGVVGRVGAGAHGGRHPGQPTPAVLHGEPPATHGAAERRGGVAGGVAICNTSCTSPGADRLARPLSLPRLLTGRRMLEIAEQLNNPLSRKEARREGNNASGGGAGEGVPRKGGGGRRRLPAARAAGTRRETTDRSGRGRRHGRSDSADR